MNTISLIAGVAVVAAGAFIGSRLIDDGSATITVFGIEDRGDQRLRARAPSPAAELASAATSGAAESTSTPWGGYPSTTAAEAADIRGGAQASPKSPFPEIGDYLDWQERERDAREAGARELQAIMQARPESDGIGDELAQDATTPQETYDTAGQEPLQTEFWVPAERTSEELAMELIESVQDGAPRETREAFEQMLEGSRSAEAPLEAPDIDPASDPVAAAKAGL